jgi:tetratricopeptide (TPR) repeat protein
LAAAEKAFDSASSVTSAYYMGPMGLKALEARVYMSMGQYDKAEAAAKEAISLKGKGDGTATDVAPSDEGYISMWTSTAISDEDIFTIVKSDNDNLSSNSLNTIYNAYYCTTQKAALKLFADTDIRKNLFVDSSSAGGIQPTKFRGTATNAAVNNIPIFRKSEMSLIIAECEARTGTVSEAQNYLLYTAKRNTAIKSVDDLPSTPADLLQFISQERIREFFEEGHRFYDARRMGDKINADNFSGFDIQKFVFPIPESELNAGFGVTQNVGWEDNLPV